MLEEEEPPSPDPALPQEEDTEEEGMAAGLTAGPQKCQNCGFGFLSAHVAGLGPVEDKACVSSPHKLCSSLT
ncbi:hypothetical protein JEQ12_013536 [Ovis aries]|uniref:Uncharacterized protein n=1 Tax=Ovis aries TaxID=9940 RepID=A0A836AHZ4_SHEEP|nr:hypothetical protein JEQ12_013536 [Ovis aries]